MGGGRGEVPWGESGVLAGELWAGLRRPVQWRGGGRHMSSVTTHYMCSTAGTTHSQHDSCRYHLTQL